MKIFRGFAFDPADPPTNPALWRFKLSTPRQTSWQQVDMMSVLY